MTAPKTAVLPHTALKPVPTPIRSLNRPHGLEHPLPTPVAHAVRHVLALLALSVGAPAVLAQGVDQDTQSPLRLRPGAALQETLPKDVQSLLPSFVSGERMEGKADGLTVIEGDVELRRHDAVIRADRIELDRRTQDAKATGNVKINRNGDRFEGPELQINVETNKGHFSQPVYELLKNDARGDASRIDFLDKDTTLVHDGRYSTCPRPPGASWLPDWMVRADRIELDNVEEVGTAKGGVLEFKGVPILAAPYLSFPLSDKRKSGVLPPSMAIDSQSGIQLTAPYYLNLAPNFDATLIPTVMSKRGVDLAGEFRYLQPSYMGEVRGAFLPSDRLRERDRWAYALQHTQTLTGPLAGGSPLGLRVNLNRVGDDNYWRDFPRSITQLTRRLLPSEGELDWRRGPWSFQAGAYKWQTLQNEGSRISAPYDRLPSLRLGYRQSNLRQTGWNFRVDSEWTRFERSSLVSGVQARFQGDRSLMVSELTRRWQEPGWFLQPKARLNMAQYQFDGTNGQQSNVNRAVPTVSLDSGLIFERSTTFFGDDYVQTLEPRAFFTWTPFRDQSELPNFDSGSRDFNLGTMFSENVFSGNDRVSDTRGVTLGLESKLLSDRTGAEVMRLGIAQRLLFEEQNVVLPGRTPTGERLSDTLFDARFQWDPLWKFGATLQYNPKASESVRSTVSAAYTPGPYRVLSAAYRTKRGVSEQLDLGWQWPVSALFGDAPAKVPGKALGPGQWYTVGRMNYSMRDRKIVDLVAGFEYDAGCWLGRVVVSRLQQSTTAANQSILFQLEFNGFSRLGSSTLQTLQQTVPQYQYLREEVLPPSRFQRYD